MRDRRARVTRPTAAGIAGCSAGRPAVSAGRRGPCTAVTAGRDGPEPRRDAQDLPWPDRPHQESDRDSRRARPGPETGTIAVGGTGRVAVAPDLADLRLGVSIARPTVAAARAEARRDDGGHPRGRRRRGRGAARHPDRRCSPSSRATTTATARPPTPDRVRARRTSWRSRSATWRPRRRRRRWRARGRARRASTA